MVLHFSKYLVADTINSIATQYGFAVPANVEKFIMDFEMQYQVMQKLECVTHGGMSMPFHTNEDARRLSIDIDLLTSSSLEQTEQKMEKIGDNLTEVSLEKIVPKDRYPIPNILSYYVRYRSCLGHDDNIKVDFLCDVDISLPKITIQPGFVLFNFIIDYPMDVLTHGSLIGDKLTTLALEKIGLPERKFSDIPKQVYDIATLLKLGSETVFQEAFSTFEKFTQFKMDHYEIEQPYKLNDIITGIEDSVFNLLDTTSSITITHKQDSRFGQFKSAFLGNSSDYKKTEHITDILIILLLSKLIHSYIDKSFTLGESVNLFNNVIDQLNKISNYNGEMRSSEHEKIYGLISSELPFNKKILKGAPLEHILLIKNIYN